MTLRDKLMQTIWKVILGQTGIQEIEVPVGAVMLCAREQHERICVWFRCNPTNPIVRKAVAVVGTGDQIPNAFDHYIGSAMLMDGALGFHIFGREAPPS